MVEFDHAHKRGEIRHNVAFKSPERAHMPRKVQAPEYGRLLQNQWKDTVPTAKTICYFWILPSELVKMILEELHLQDGAMTPVMMTCRTFYDIITNTPRLWRRILISVDSMPLTLRQGSTMACQTPDFLKRCIHRTGKTQIEATLVIGQIHSDSPDPAVRAEMYKLILEHSERISFLCVIINPGTPVDMVIKSFQDIFTKGFQALESLMIASAVPLSGLLPAFQGLLEQIEETSTKLGSLYLENLQKDFIMAARAYDFWRKLRRITLKGEYQPLHATVFEGCEGLDFLSFTGELLVNPEDALPAPVPRADTTTQPTTTVSALSSNIATLPQIEHIDDRSRPVHLPQLQWLRLGAITMSGLAHLKISRVRFLVIQTALRDYVAVPPAPYSVILPELEVLHVAAVHTDIKCIVAPKLQTLCLQIQALKRIDANNIVLTLFDSHESMWRPRNFSLSAPIHDKHLVTVLKRLPGLESLTLTHQDVPKNTLFTTLRRHRILPKLQSLSLEFHATGKGDGDKKDQISAKIQEIARARENAPVRLEWFSWKWGSTEEVVVRRYVCPQCKSG